jgi:RNA-directed DNA polymerase
MTKPFNISKIIVWEAYQKVKANGGSAGVDNETIQAFDQNLKDNLYKLWNRLSSGSYFPPRTSDDSGVAPYERVSSTMVDAQI